MQKCNKPKAATTTASNVFAPIVKTDNIFKVPQASPPISPKQQQQQKWQQQQQQKVTPNIFGTAAATAAASSPSQNIFANVPKMNKTDEFAKAHNSYINSIFTPIERTTPSNSSSTNTMANTNIFANVSKMPASNNIFGGNAFGTTAAAADFKQDNIFQHFKSPNSNASPSNSSTGLFAQAVAAKRNVNQRDPRIQLEQQRQVEALALAEEHKRLQANLEAERAKLKELQQQKERERQEAKQREMQRLQQQKDNLIIKAENLNTQFLKDFINEELLKLATEQLNLYKALEARSLELTQQLIEDILMDEITEMAKEEYAFICHDQMILNRYFERWLQHTQRKKQQRLLMQSTPLWVSTETRAEQSQNLLHPSQNENLQLIKRYRHGAACDFKALLYQTNNEAQRKPLNLFSIIAHISFKPNLERVGLLQPLKFFKMIISLPLEMEELPGFESMCNNWMTKYIEKPPNHQSKAFLCYKQQQVALCIRKLSGINALNEQSVKVTTEGNNSDALILMLSCVNLQQTRKRLHRLLKFAHLNKPIPLAIIVFNGLNATAAEIMQALECENLLKNELICDYRIFGIGLAKADFRFEHLLEKAVKFAYAHKEKRKEQEKSLQMLSLQSFLHDTLGKYG